MCLWIIFHSTDSVCPSLQHLKRWFHIFLFCMHTHSSSPLSRRQIIWSCLLHPSAVRWYSPLPYSAVSLSLGGGGFTLWFYFSPPLLLLLLWPIWQAAATKTDVSNRHTQTQSYMSVFLREWRTMWLGFTGSAVMCRCASQVWPSVHGMETTHGARAGMKLDALPFTLMWGVGWKSFSCGSGGLADHLLIRRLKVWFLSASVCMLKYPWVRYWNLSCFWCVHWSVKDR